jgi:hypothetical protein
MAIVQDPPGERRLERPPSERFRATDTDDAPPTATSAGRGVALGALAGLVGAAVLVVLGGVAAVTAGLIVVAAAVGYGVGVAVRTGSGSSLRRATRSGLAAAIAGLAVALGQLGLWLYAQAEGGVLSLPDLLGQVYGVLVPIELLVAVVVAWWAAR